MARAYVIHIMDAEFRIFGNKTEVAELLYTISKNTVDAMKWRGHCNDDFWESDDCDEMATFANWSAAEAKRIAPDYFGTMIEPK